MPKTYYLAFILILSLSAFQNCAPLQGASSTQATTAPAEDLKDDELAEEDIERFKAGDPFVIDEVPGNPSVEQISKLQNYLNSTESFKALAVTQNGGFYALVGQASQAEADRRAQEICQVFFANTPCAVIASGNTFHHGEKDLKNAFVNVLDTGVRAFDPSKIPLLRDEDRNATRFARYQAHLNQVVQNQFDPPGKRDVVLAITYWGDFYFNYYQPAGIDASTERYVLQRCEALYGTPCTTYAINNNVVFNANSFNWNNTSKILGFTGILFFRDGTQDLRMRPDHETIAVNVFGHSGYAFGFDTQADEDARALQECNAVVNGGPDDAGCVLIQNITSLIKPNPEPEGFNSNP